jgi:hydroxysqualene dehydroxylase
LSGEPHVYVVGAGLSGLATAVDLACAGAKVVLYEASQQAGGRCRSYLDPVLEMEIDNGNHFILTGNANANAYLKRTGGSAHMAPIAAEGPSYHDFRADARWTLRPNPGPVPWWVLADDRRTPGAPLSEYLALAALLAPPRGKRIEEVMACKGVLWDRMLGSFLLGALNTEPEKASADLASSVIRKSFARGGAAYRPMIATSTLAAALVDPALALLGVRGARVRFGERLKSLRMEGNRIAALDLTGGEETVHPGSLVVLAVPPWIAQDLVPGLIAPDDFRSIVNGHFKLPAPAGAPPMLGLIGATAEWVFAYPDRISVTVSGADAIVDDPREDLARRFWADIARTYGLPLDPLPSWQIVKERRATFAATPEQDAKRPDARTSWSNLFLAGDWTQTGLPGTIEGATQSGALAARLVLAEMAR